MNPLRLAWSNLKHQRIRTFVSLAGVGFAVLLVFMQLGFLGAVFTTATLVYDQLNFDVVILSKEYVSLNEASSFLRTRLGQARANPAVAAARPLTATVALWRDPRPPENGTDGARRSWSILTLAIDPATMDRLFVRPVGTIFRDAEEFRRDASLLGRLDTVLVDRTSRPEYGDPVLWKALGSNEWYGRRVEIGGDIRIGTGFGYNGLLLTSEETLHRAGWPDYRITHGLLELRPGSDPEAVAAELTAALPKDVIVLSRARLTAQEQEYWLTSTAAGQFFLAGVVIALIVGCIFVYQMMAADISKLLPEYATIRALGYRGEYLSRVVYSQGLLLAVVGFLPGLLVSLACYEFIYEKSGIPLAMTPLRAGGVFFLTAFMCLASASLAVRKVRRANPADLF
jgi:putative ABC transport system permease protein